MSRFYKWSIVFGAVGIAVSLALLLAARLINGDPKLATSFGYPLNRITRVIWPSSVWLMATEGIEKSLRGYLIVFIATAANAVLYACIGCLLWWLKDVLLTRARE